MAQVAGYVTGPELLLRVKMDQWRMFQDILWDVRCYGPRTYSIRKDA